VSDHKLPEGVERYEPGVSEVNMQEGGDLTTLLQKVKDEVNRRRAVEDSSER
jgi:hypothetical protein